MRSHASYIVNIYMINTFVRGSLNSVIMQNGDTLPVSRQRKMALLSRL
ncbi:MAG: LytTR family transcriptional regulator DNA-binding domain-containing protein [Bacteroidota bacterium]